MTFRCRQGHLSEEPDYCSVCGIAIAAAPAPAVAASPRVVSTPLPSSVRAALPGACPACGEPRADPDARFCEVCRYDFVSRKAGPPPIGARPATPSAPPSPPSVPPPAPRANPSAFDKWEIAVAVDPSLDTEPDPEAPCPKDAPTALVPVDRTDMLIGRHDERRDIHPELPVHDPGASRRHAKLVLSADGTLELLDLASTNGTGLNGVSLAAGARAALKAGDEITLGRWTRITVRAKMRGAP
jgi:hypothetical protein